MSVDVESPVIERRPRSRSFGSGTPTFSSDLAKLRAACPGCGGDDSVIVHSYPEAVALVSSTDILGSHSPLKRKVSLDDEEGWKAFIDASGAAATTGGGEDPPVSIDLEKLLRHCFDVAFKMPPSPIGAGSKSLKSSGARVTPDGSKEDADGAC
ncbi:hypothetical protein ACHAWF_016494 [Thalassiosira exigua]